MAGTPTARDVLLQQVADLRENGLGSDIKIVCGSETFDVHKNILMTRSPVFKQALSDARWKENRDDRYIMDAANDDPCSDPVAIRMMIQFMYSGDYNLGLDPRGKLALKDLPEVPSKFNEARALPEEYRDMGNGRLDLHLKLFVLGDKYNIPSLMTLAVSTVRSDIQWQVWNDIAVRDLLANMHKWSPQHDTSFQEMMCVMLLRRRANGKTWSNVVDEQIEIMPGFGLLLFKQFTDNVIQVPAIAKMISDASDETTYITKEQYWWNKKQDSTSPASIVPQPTATYEGSSRKRFAR